MAHAQVGNHRFEDRLGFALETLPIGYCGFTGAPHSSIPLVWTRVLKPEGAVVRAGGLEQLINTGVGSPLA